MILPGSFMKRETETDRKRHETEIETETIILLGRFIRRETASV